MRAETPERGIAETGVFDQSAGRAGAERSTSEQERRAARDQVWPRGRARV
jgi:hypothetical protein